MWSDGCLGGGGDAGSGAVAVPMIVPRTRSSSGFPSGPRFAASRISASCWGVSGRRRAMVAVYPRP